MPSIHLTESRIEALECRKSPYNVRDAELKGFGVRVLPSGARRFFIHSQHEGRRLWKTVSDAGSIGVDEVRKRATDLLAAIRRDKPAALPEDRLFEAVAEEVFDRYGRHWKPGTMKVNRKYFQSTILPRFGGRDIAAITRQEVQRWFASLHATPVAADRSAPILSVIMRQAEIYGYRPEGSNPCTGIRRYRRKGRERFLSGPELRRLAPVLENHEERHSHNVAFIRLLLLTGCRKGEIVYLRREEVRDDRLELADTKTGPRTVLLNAPARRIVARWMQEGNGPWVFPSIRDPSRPSSREPWLWYRVRHETGIEDVRLHDLRHTVASQAAMNGVPLPVVARLLGHSNVRMTMRYAHVGDREIEAAAERVGQTIAEMIGMEEPAPEATGPSSQRQGPHAEERPNRAS